jgi:hypothetical protein
MEGYPAMLHTAVLASIAQQMMSGNTVDVNGKNVPVRRTSRNRFRTLAFTMDGREYQAIEQNAEKPSRWGQLAREGHQVVQFKDVGTSKFVAVAVGHAVRSDLSALTASPTRKRDQRSNIICACSR